MDNRVFVLHVEDNPHHAQLVRLALEEQTVPCDVHTAADGEEGLRYLEAASGDDGDNPRPDIVLLDLRLPHIDGLEVLRRIKANSDLLRIPVVIFTSSARQADIDQAYALYANSYVVKPISYDDLCDTLGDLMHYWSERNIVGSRR
jgi:CheY-like chemotaxis protein